MVRVSEHFNIGVQLLKSMFGVLHMLQMSHERIFQMVKEMGYFRIAYRRIKSEGSLNLLVHNNIDLDSTFGGSLKHSIKAILLVTRRGPTKIQLRTQPPIEDIYTLLGACEEILSTFMKLAYS